KAMSQVVGGGKNDFVPNIGDKDAGAIRSCVNNIDANTHGISMVTWYSRHRSFFKIVAITLIVAFLFQQTGAAGDLLEYKRRQSESLRNLLPTGQESDQKSRSLPSDLKRMESRHHEIIRLKQDIDEGVLGLQDGIKKKVAESAEEDLPLKGPRGTGGPEGDGKAADYTLTNPDQQDNPHDLNQIQNPTNSTGLDKYDITRLDAGQLAAWMAGTQAETDDETGEQYWVGYGAIADPDDDRKIQEIRYDMHMSTADEKKIDYILTGYVLNEESGEYEASYKIEYEYNASGDVEETNKYDITGDEEKLVEKATYEGSDDDNRISKIEYFKDEELTEKKEFTYGGDGELEKTTDYKFIKDSETGETEERKTSETFFTGEKKKEKADYTLEYNKDSEVTSTTIYFYKNGGRAETAEDKEAKTKAATYWGNVREDENGEYVLVDEDGEYLIDEETGDHILAKKKTELFFDRSIDRIPGEEVADYRIDYNRNGVATKISIYLYVDGKRAEDANYRETMTSIITYYWEEGLDADGDGKITEEELENAVKKSQTFFDYEFRLKGEEIADYTIAFQGDGETIKDTTVYFYEGIKRAKDSTTYDRMARSVTYWNGDVLDEEGEIKENTKKKSETFFQFKEDAERGEELADLTISYYRDGETPRESVIYFYEGNKRAAEADPYEDGLERTASFWGDAAEALSLLNGDGTYNIEAIKDFMLTKFDIDISSLGTASAFITELLNLISDGNAALIEFILNLDLDMVLSAENLTETLLALFGGDSYLISLLLAIDMSAVSSKEDFIRELFKAGGIGEDEAILGAILLSMDLTEYTSIEDFVRAFINEAAGKGVFEDALELALLHALAAGYTLEQTLQNLISL
ncbi:MAG: hypothetical protein HQ579_09235, partial [Candidatus Omnitrophica bacterium]|nr:hypothetical protein [Candidatus Omnitrophota bacterium]